MPEQACKIKYIYVEMILNKETTYDVVSGLFRGIKEKDDQKFVLIAGMDKNHTSVLNMDFYNLMTIEVLEEDCREMVFLTAEKTDQEKAFEILDGRYKKVLAAGYNVVSDDEVIDLDKYRDVPESYLKGKPIKSTTATTTNTSTGTPGVGQFATPGNRYNRNNSTSGYTRAATTVKVEPKPTAFERGPKSKKLNPEVLEDFHSKIDAIMAGDYEAQLPAIGGPEVDEEDIETSAVCGYM